MRGRVHGEIDGWMEWEAHVVVREDKEREGDGVGSLNSKKEESRVIKEKGRTTGRKYKGGRKGGFEEGKGGAAFEILYTYTH